MIAAANEAMTDRMGDRPGGGAWLVEDQVRFYDSPGGVTMVPNNSRVLASGAIVPDEEVLGETGDSLIYNFGWWSVYRPRVTTIHFSAEESNAYNYNDRWESFSTYTSSSARIKSWWSLIPLAESYEASRFGSTGSDWDYAVGSIESGMERYDGMGYSWAQQGVRSSNSSAEFTGVAPKSSANLQNCRISTVETGVGIGGGSYTSGGASVSVSSSTEQCERTTVAGTTSQRGWFTQTYRPLGNSTMEARELYQSIGLRWPEGTFWGPQVGHGINSCWPAGGSWGSASVNCS